MAKWIHCSNKGRPPAHRDHCGINAAHEANLRSTLWKSEVPSVKPKKQCPEIDRVLQYFALFSWVKVGNKF